MFILGVRDCHGFVAVSLGDRLHRHDGICVEVTMQSSAGKVGKDYALPEIEVASLQPERGNRDGSCGGARHRGRGSRPDEGGELKRGSHHGALRRGLSAAAADEIAAAAALALIPSQENKV
jgi:hypothetical protein